VKKRSPYFTCVILSVILFFFNVSISNAQDRFNFIEERLKELSKDNPGLKEKVDLSVNGTSIQEFIRGIASENNLNVSVDASLNTKIFNNFSGVTVADVFLFLCKKYDLEINFVGSIMSFSAYALPVEIKKIIPKSIKINYDRNKDIISFDFANDSLPIVARELTKATQTNIVFAPELNGKLISGYIENMSLKSSMENLGFSNELKITQANDGVFYIEKKDKDLPSKTSVKSNGNYAFNNSPGLSLTIENDMATINTINTPISDIITAVSGQMKKSFLLFSEPKGNTTLSLTNVSYDEFLKYLLNGSDYTVKKEGEIYLIGDRNLEGLRNTKVVQLKYRTIDKVIDLIPSELKKNVEVKTFTDLNSLILSGSQPRIDEIEKFLLAIDRVVPNIQIEILIVDIRNTKTVATGIEAGLGSQKTKTTGQLYPGYDMSVGAKSFNNLISGLNGLGLVNLGKVTPLFYVKLKALEEQGILKLRSTPQVATLNGNEAKLSIGKTEVYLEVQNQVIGTLTPQTVSTQNYKTVNADLSVIINPIVSGDDQITLDINVKQSSFTERISPTAPPGTISREFKSLVRVKNEEMIVLGGLEENTTNDTGKGVPFLSRIPVLKWLFSSRTKAKSKNKLTIFIKPTVIY